MAIGPRSGTERPPEEPGWIEGTPEKGLFGKLKERDWEHLPVTAFRCPECGRLELVARRI
jgi:hypothetical protein